jgi:hypothetical protein
MLNCHKIPRTNPPAILIKSTMLPDRNNDGPPVRLIAKLFTSISFGLVIFGTFAGQVYPFLLLSLPSYYAARASQAPDANPSSSTQAPEGLLPSLLMHWQMLSVASALIIPSVHVSYFLNRCKTISPPHPGSSTILGIFQLPGAFALIDVRTAGFISLACAFVGMVFSCLLILSFGSSRADSDDLISTESNTRVWQMVSIYYCLINSTRSRGRLLSAARRQEQICLVECICPCRPSSYLDSLVGYSNSS